MLIQWTLLFVLLPVSRCKIVTSSVKLGGEGNEWKYLTKFGFYTGTSPYKVRFRPARNAAGFNGEAAELSLELHLDEEWEMVDNLPVCERNATARRVWSIPLKPDGDWSDWSEGLLTQRVRPHVWYFALADCAQQLRPRTQIDFEFSAKQEDGSEFSVELYGTLAVASCKIILGAIFLAGFMYCCFELQRKGGSLPHVVMVLSLAILAQFLAYALHWIHLYAYRSNGQGVKLCDVLGEVFLMLSQIGFTSLAILLAQGYTVIAGSSISTDVAAALAFITVLHLVLVMWSKLRDDASYKFHENEGASGLVLVLFRLGLYAWFAFAMKQTYSQAAGKQRIFAHRFFLATSLYFLSYPTIFLIAKLFAPYLRHKFMLAGVFLMQAWSLSWYTSMFLTRGLFFEVSDLGGNFLPTPQGSRKKPRLFGRGDEKSQ